MKLIDKIKALILGENKTNAATAQRFFDYSPAEEHPYLQKAWAVMSASSYSYGANAHINRFLKKYPNHYYGQYLKAVAVWGKDAYFERSPSSWYLDQIETALKAAVQNEPLYLPARLLQVHLLRLRKKWAEANKLLDDLLKIDPHPLIEQTRNEVENYRLKRTQQDSAERQTRAHQNALNNVSNLYNNHYHGSVDWANIKRAIAGIPKEVVLNNQYYAMISGHVNMMTGNYVEAISDLNASLELYPNYHYATDILGKTYEAMGNIEKAVELYNSTIANNYHQYDTRLRRGILLCELGDIEGARTDIEFYKRYYPNNMETYEATAVLLAAEGDIKGALDQLIWCFTTFPSQIKPKHYLLRASLQKELNNPQEAFADLNHYIRLMPNDTNAQDLLQSWA